MCRSELPSLRICISISFKVPGEPSPASFLIVRTHTCVRVAAVPLKPSVPLSALVVCWHMFLAFCRRLADPLFVSRLKHLATGGVAFIEHLGEEVAITVLVEDQFALGRCGVDLCAPNFEESGS